MKTLPLAYDFQDSQSDPRQSVAIPEHLVANPQVIIESGNFSSAPMAASPVYRRDVPSVIYHTVAINPRTGRVQHATCRLLTVKDGERSRGQQRRADDVGYVT